MNVRPLPQVRCRECGADNNAFASCCWICRRSLVDEEELVEAVMIEPPAFVAGTHTKIGNALLALTLLALATVGVGVGMINWVLLAFYGIWVCIPSLAVGVTLRGILAAKDKPTATWGLSVVLVVVSLVGLLTVSIGILFFTICYQMFRS